MNERRRVFLSGWYERKEKDQKVKETISICIHWLWYAQFGRNGDKRGIKKATIIYDFL